MTKPTITIHNCETGEIINREMNNDEFQQYEADQLEATEKAKAEATKIAEKAALLAKLGITDDEAKLLLS
jgi:lipoate synthase